jgi:hypothetical protein
MSTLILQAIFAFAVCGSSVSLGSTKLLSDFNFHRSLQPFLKHFYRRQSFQQLQHTMQRVDVCDPALTNENRSGAHFFLLQIFYSNILHTVSLLIPVIPSNMRTLKVQSSATHFRMTSVDSSVPEIEGWPLLSSSCNDCRPSLNVLCHSNTPVLDKHSSP